MGYTPNYSHLVGIMIINHWVQGYTTFSDKPILVLVLISNLLAQRNGFYLIPPRSHGSSFCSWFFPTSWATFRVNVLHRYGSIPIILNVSGMNIHKSQNYWVNTYYSPIILQLFWGFDLVPGFWMVLTHPHMLFSTAGDLQSRQDEEDGGRVHAGLRVNAGFCFAVWWGKGTPGVQRDLWRLMIITLVGEICQIILYYIILHYIILN